MIQAHYFGLEKLSDELMQLAVNVEQKKEVSCTLTHTLYCGQKIGFYYFSPSLFLSFSFSFFCFLFPFALLVWHFSKGCQQPC